MNIQEIQEEYSEQSRENIAKAYQRFQDALVKQSEAEDYFEAVTEWAYKRSYQSEYVFKKDTCICGVQIYKIFEFEHKVNKKVILVGSQCMQCFLEDMDPKLRKRIKKIISVFNGAKKHSIGYCKTNNLINSKHIKFVEDQDEYRDCLGRTPNRSLKQKKYYNDVKTKAHQLFKQRSPELLNKYLEKF